MSNPDHIAKLLQGPPSWNAWHEANPEIMPDLSGAKLTLAAGMPGHVFRGPLDLRQANLHAADLSGMPLIAVDLTSASLDYAKLCNADLSDSDLTLADLSHADLTGARLANCDLSGARFDDAQLAHADLGGTFGVTQDQMLVALCDDTTVFPADLDMSQAWREKHEEAASWEDPEVWSDAEAGDGDHPATPHELLQVPEHAGPEQIRASFRALAKKYHPDVNPGDTLSETRFKQINEAYRVAIEAHELASQASSRRRARGWGVAFAIGLGCLLIPGAIYLMGSEEPPKRTAVAIADDPVTGTEKQTIRLTLPPAAPSKAPPVEARPDRLDEDAPASASGKTITEPAEPQIKTTLRPEEKIETRTEPQEQMQDEAAASLPAPKTIAPTKASKGDEARPQKLAALTAPARKVERPVEPWREDWKHVRRLVELRAIENSLAGTDRKPAAADQGKENIRTVFASSRTSDAQQSVVREPRLTPQAFFTRQRLASLSDAIEAHRKDLRAWASAQTLDTMAAYRSYLLDNRDGMYAEQAGQRLAVLEAEVTFRRRDDAAWAQARGKSTADAFETYRRNFPQGRYTQTAGERIAALELEEVKRVEALKAREDESWQTAANLNTRSALQGYLDAYPDGRYAEPAKKKLEALKVAAAPPATAHEQHSEPAPARPKRSLRRANRFPTSDEPFVEAGPRSY